MGENALTIVTTVKYWKKWSKWLAFINCQLCHFIYVNQNQTRVIEREVFPFWTTESKAETFSAAVTFANEKTLRMRTLFPTVALPIPVTVGTIEYIKEKHYADLSTNSSLSL